MKTKIKEGEERKMKVVKASTALGKRLVAIGQKWEGKFLNQVYDKWSTAKQEAWVNVMMNIVVQMVQKSFQFVHIILLALHVHGLHLKV